MKMKTRSIIIMMAVAISGLAFTSFVKNDGVIPTSTGSDTISVPTNDSVPTKGNGIAIADTTDSSAVTTPEK